MHRFAPSVRSSGDGPYASFTDLLASIVFVFLLLIAALILEQSSSTRTSVATPDQIEQMQEWITNLQRENSELQARLGQETEMARRDAMIQTQIEQMRYQNAQLQAKVSQQEEVIKRQAAAQKLVPALTVNVYSEQLFPSHDEMAYVSTLDIYTSGDASRFVPVERATAGTHVSVYRMDKAPDFATLQSFSCVRTISKQRLLAECKDTGKRATTDLRRVSADIYEGTSTVEIDGQQYKFHVRHEIINLNEPRLRW